MTWDVLVLSMGFQNFIAVFTQANITIYFHFIQCLRFETFVSGISPTYPIIQDKNINNKHAIPENSHLKQTNKASYIIAPRKIGWFERDPKLDTSLKYNLIWKKVPIITQLSENGTHSLQSLCHRNHDRGTTILRSQGMIAKTEGHIQIRFFPA